MILKGMVSIGILIVLISLGKDVYDEELVEEFDEYTTGSYIFLIVLHILTLYCIWR